MAPAYTQERTGTNASNEGPNEAKNRVKKDKARCAIDDGPGKRNTMPHDELQRSHCARGHPSLDR